MGFVHMAIITMKRLYLQSYFDIIYFVFVVDPTAWGFLTSSVQDDPLLSEQFSRKHHKICWSQHSKWQIVALHQHPKIPCIAGD